jgi:hypothetical protein
MLQRSKAFLFRLIRAMKTLARDERIPKPLRWVAGLALLPIPGPVDEIVLILLAPVFLLYREPLREVLGAGRELIGPIGCPG